MRLTDGRTPAYRDWREGYDPDTWLDRAIHATRRRSSRCTASTRCPEPRSAESNDRRSAQADTPCRDKFLW